MATVWKDILWAGKWTYADGRVLRVSPATIRTALANGTRMLSSGLDVPFCWEHQPDTFPRPVEMSSTIYGSADRRAEWAKNVLARVERYKTEHVPGRGTVLFAGFDDSTLSRDEIARVRACGKVSCRLDLDFEDARGSGHAYPGLSVSHVAITPKPVEPKQGPFLMGRGASKKTYYLGAAMADKMDDEDAIEPEPAEPVEELAEPAVMDGDGMDDMQGLSQLIEALRSRGDTIPDEVMDIAGLVIAIKAGGMKPTDGGGDPNGMDYSSGGPQQAPAPPMMMSQSQMAAKRPNIVQMDRRELSGRIKSLVSKGRISPVAAGALNREFTTFELSYTKDATVASFGLVAKIAAYEELPAGMVLSRKSPGFQMSATTKTAERPEAYDVGTATLAQTIAYQTELAKNHSVRS